MKVLIKFSNSLPSVSLLPSADILCKELGPRSGPPFLDPDQARQNVGPDLGPNSLTEMITYP